MANSTISENTDNTYDLSEVELFRTNIKRFIQAEIAPDYEQWRKAGIMPREVWNKIGEAGFLCVDIPEEYGGFDAHFIFSAAVLEEFSSAGLSGLATSIGVHSDIVARYILDFGTEDQKHQYLPKMISGECVGAIAMTEPGAGSDLQGVSSSAKLDGKDYIINGAKTFITNGQLSDLVIVVAITNPEVAGSRGLSLFAVDASIKGFNRGRNLAKIGFHESDTSELFFEDMRLPASTLLGELNQGFACMMQALSRERLMLAINAVAASEGALAWTIDYVEQRHAFGKPISQLQNTRFRIAEMKTETRVHRSFINECIELLGRGELDAATASMAKLSTTELQGRVTDGCLQLFGGYGYMEEYPISHAFVDARVQRIYGGTSEIMKEIIARSILGR